MKKISMLWSALFKKMLLSSNAEVHSLLYWRTKILFSILISSTLLGSLVLVFVIPAAIESKLWKLLFVDSIALLMCLLLLIVPRISYTIRATIFLLGVYGVGLNIIFSIGLISGGPIWIFCFPILSAILLGFRAGMFSIFVNAVTIAILGYLITSDILAVSSSSFSIHAIYGTCINFLFLNALATISISVLIMGLMQFDEKEKILSSSLEKSESLYDLISDNVADIIWTMDMDFKFTYISPSIFKQRGYTIKEGMDQSLNEAVTPDSFTKAMDLFAERIKLIENNHPDGWESIIFEVEQLCKDGTTIWTSNNVRFLKGSDNQPYGILGVTRDISEQKLIEKAKAKAELHATEQSKHALVGRVAGKMAHDFNNILGIIMGNTELALLESQEPEIQRVLKLIFDQTIRGKNLTKNLVIFAKDQEPKQEFFIISKKIKLVITLLKKDLEGIKLINEEEQKIPQIFADPGMIEHSLVNLFQNSIHALSLTDNPVIILRTYYQNDNICFEIEDNGCGIPEQHLKNIYELAFTLKGSMDATSSYGTDIKGTGYGMCNVKKYIEQHNGDISVESKLGSGTKFTIRLPAQTS